jgi:SAM-dependent methyltransferase
MPSSVRAHGDFTGLASDYSKFRPGYSESVLAALVALVDKPPSEIDAVDVGANTGIWTRMLAASGLRSVVAVEPNDDMRAHGVGDSGAFAVTWLKGSGEETGLPSASADLLSMASSFHWVDFDRGTREFHRVLRPGGRFVALWNPRYLDDSPDLLDIEAHLKSLNPDVQRVSSGRSGIADKMTGLLNKSPLFEDVVYLEGRQTRAMTLEQYLGVWRSVNDLQVQLGPEKFARFLDYVRDRLSGRDMIETINLTRAWSARRSGG